ncbi:MAG: hypothetical protein WDO15_13715 [Bacteroidota bacterium]
MRKRRLSPTTPDFNMMPTVSHSSLTHLRRNQKKWAADKHQHPSFDVSAFSIANKKDKIPMAIVKMDIVLNKVCISK